MVWRWRPFSGSHRWHVVDSTGGMTARRVGGKDRVEAGFHGAFLSAGSTTEQRTGISGGLHCDIQPDLAQVSTVSHRPVA